MAFELAHHRFKGWLVSNVNDGAQVSGVERAIAFDWVSRVSSLYDMWCDGDESHVMYELLGLQGLLLGMDAFSFHHGDHTWETFSESFHASMVSTFRAPVLFFLKQGSSLLRCNMTGK